MLGHTWELLSRGNEGGQRPLILNSLARNSRCVTRRCHLSISANGSLSFSLSPSLVAESRPDLGPTPAVIGCRACCTLFSFSAVLDIVMCHRVWSSENKKQWGGIVRLSSNLNQALTLPGIFRNSSSCLALRRNKTCSGPSMD